MSLLQWRNTPSSGFNSTPAQRLMSRELRTKLPVTENQLKKRYNNNEDDIENLNKNKKLQP